MVENKLVGMGGIRARGSYSECVQRAIGFGHDTDTTAAIAGGLAGIAYGVDGIPLEWLHALRGRTIVEDIAARL